jgi:hypothetical protein
MKGTLRSLNRFNDRVWVRNSKPDSYCYSPVPKIKGPCKRTIHSAIAR